MYGPPNCCTRFEREKSICKDDLKKKKKNLNDDHYWQKCFDRSKLNQIITRDEIWVSQYVPEEYHSHNLRDTRKLSCANETSRQLTPFPHILAASSRCRGESKLLSRSQSGRDVSSNGNCRRLHPSSFITRMRPRTQNCQFVNFSCENYIPVFLKSPYSADLSPCGSYFFPKLKSRVRNYSLQRTGDFTRPRHSLTTFV
jgi:hypothetical protein